MIKDAEIIPLARKLHKSVRLRADAKAQLHSLDIPHQIKIWERLGNVTRAGVDHLIEDMQLKLLFPTKRGPIVYGTLQIDEFMLTIRLKSNRVTIFCLAKNKDYKNISYNKTLIIFDDQHDFCEHNFRVTGIIAENYIIIIWTGIFNSDRAPPRGLEMLLAA